MRRPPRPHRACAHCGPSAFCHRVRPRAHSGRCAPPREGCLDGYRVLGLRAGHRPGCHDGMGPSASPFPRDRRSPGGLVRGVDAIYDVDAALGFIDGEPGRRRDARRRDHEGRAVGVMVDRKVGGHVVLAEVELADTGEVDHGVSLTTRAIAGPIPPKESRHASECARSRTRLIGLPGRGAREPIIDPAHPAPVPHERSDRPALAERVRWRGPPRRAHHP